MERGLVGGILDDGKPKPRRGPQQMVSTPSRLVRIHDAFQLPKTCLVGYR